MDEQHVYYHHEEQGPRVTLKIEKNSRGVNWEVSIVQARTVDEGMELLREAETKLRAEYGEAV